MTIISVYVDDLIIIAPNQDEMDEIVSRLNKDFKMKDMGSLHYCLGVNIEQHESEFRLSQKQYIIKMLERHSLQDATPASTPMDPNVQHVINDGYSKPSDKTEYQSMISSLLYTAIGTRPDISQAVGALSKFNVSPTEAHLTAELRELLGVHDTL
eukprot:gene4292-4861_t